MILLMSRLPGGHSKLVIGVCDAVTLTLTLILALEWRDVCVW